MESDSSKLENDLENEEDFLNEIIESNREMDNLLLESDFALETAESELKATIKDIPSIISEDDETSSALSIEVSEDLFKGFTPEINFSPLQYSDNKESKFKEQKLPDNLNNLLNDFNASLKSYNDDFQKDNNDNTLNPDIQYDQENTESSSNINKTVIIKSTVTFDSEEEHDYLYADLYKQTLEITVPNAVNENMNHSPIAETLKHQNHFEGCSPEFDFKNIGNEFTVIVSTEQNHSRAENNIYEPFKINNKVVPEELNNDIVEKTTESFKIDNELVSDDNSAHQNAVLKEGNITAIDDKNILIDQIKLEENDNVDKTSETSKINSEIPSNDMNVTFRNFIQTEFSIETIRINTTEEKSFLNNAETIDNCVPLQNNNDIKCSTLQTTENNAEVVTLNENNNVVPQTLKRPAEDIPTSENKAKKQKLNDKPATVTKETIPGTSKTNNDPASSKTDEIIIIPLPADPTSSTADINFTQAIFVDHEETADNNDPKWSVLKDLETNEDYFESVRTQWRSLSLPNPHKSNTTRYVPENIAKNEPHTATSSENERVTSCGEFLEKRIRNMSSEINGLYAKMNRVPRFKGKTERHRINSDVEHLRHLQHEVEKNKEELKHINMFYYNDSQGWNANYLTQPELSELEEQDQVLKFQKNFYK